MRNVSSSKRRMLIAISLIILFSSFVISDLTRNPHSLESRFRLNDSKKPAQKTPSSVKEVKSAKERISPKLSVYVNQAPIEHPNRVSAKVIDVKDGDTIVVELDGGVRKTLRYIGIDTPEIVDPRRPVQCFGKEASNINKSLIANQIVQLEKDISETDKYGRLLRYVLLGDIFVNEYLVAEGFAYASSYPPDIKYQEDLKSAENGAREANKGLWGSCASQSANTRSSANTNPSIDKDCSDFSSHKDAQEYFNSKGGSGKNNIDKLDGSDHDGIVCETLP